MLVHCARRSEAAGRRTSEDTTKVGADNNVGAVSNGLAVRVNNFGDIDLPHTATNHVVHGDGYGESQICCRTNQRNDDVLSVDIGTGSINASADRGRTGPQPPSSPE